MKKIMLLAAFAVFSFTSVNAQGELRAGLNVGTTIGDFSDGYGIGFGLDATYLFEVSEDFKVGGATGFQSISGDTIESSQTVAGITVTQEVEFDNFNYIPLAAAGRFMASDAFVLGADVGYANVVAPDH